MGELLLKLTTFPWDTWWNAFSIFILVVLVIEATVARWRDQQLEKRIKQLEKNAKHQ